MHSACRGILPWMRTFGIAAFLTLRAVKIQQHSFSLKSDVIDIACEFLPRIIVVTFLSSFFDRFFFTEIVV